MYLIVRLNFKGLLIKHEQNDFYQSTNDAILVLNIISVIQTKTNIKIQITIRLILIICC